MEGILGPVDVVDLKVRNSRFRRDAVGIDIVNCKLNLFQQVDGDIYNPVDLNSRLQNNLSSQSENRRMVSLIHSVNRWVRQ